MHVLLIEPDPIQARSYQAALEAAGHSVARAPSAQTAVYQADEQTPDVVVLELQLPHHNGVEFLYEFRSYPEWLAVPVLLHTFVPAHELAHTAQLQQQLGVVRALYKLTTSLTQLCDAVQRVSLAAAS